MDSCSVRKTVVIRLGGSVHLGASSYRQASRFIVRRLHRCDEERFVVVVSAQEGLTDVFLPPFRPRLTAAGSFSLAKT
jgi:aspartokinase